MKKGENGKKKTFFTKKKVLVIVGIVVVLIFGGGFATLKASDNPSFCGICHVMDKYLASYEKGSLLAKKHADAGVKCHDCHETSLGNKMQEVIATVTGNYETPLKKRNFGKREYCLDCHNDSKKVDKVFKTVKAETSYDDASNPHDNHNGDLDCNVCHNMHRKSEVYCQSCHTFSWFGDLDKKSWNIE